MGICGRLLSLYRREEPPVDKRGKACLANGELYTIKYSPHLRVRDVCIEIAKQLNIAPVALDFFTLMTTDCEHCLRPNRQIKQQCDKQNDHYLNPKRVLHEDELASKVFFFRLAFKAVAGPDLKVVNGGAFEYFVMQCRWDYLNGRINNLTRKDHLTLLVLESIIRSHEEGVSAKEVLDNPKRFGLAQLFVDDEYSCKEIRSHLKKQLAQFKTAQSHLDKAKNSFLYVLEGVTDFGVTKIVVKKFYYQSASVDVVYPVEWEILVSPNGLKKRRTYKDERDVENEDTSTSNNRVDEMISDYKDIEYLEIKQSQSDEIIHISRQKGFLEVISVGKSMIKKESLVTLIEGFYHLFVNQYKTLTKYEPGLELPMLNVKQTRKLPVHGPIERKKVGVLLKAVEVDNGDRSGVHLIRRSRKEFDTYVLSFIHGNEIKHFEIVLEDDKYAIKNGPKFESMTQLLDFYKTAQERFPTVLTKYCPIPKDGLCALYDDQIVVEAPCVPSTSRPANPVYTFEYIGNRQLERLHHTFTCGDIGDKIFKARLLNRDNGGFQEVFCRRIETSRAPTFKDKVVKIGENMAKLVHKNLVQFNGVQFNDDQNTYLAFEWLNAGTLDDYLKKKTDVKVETILAFAAQIAEACMFLHEQNYVHGWLAAHNVLIVNEHQVKLSDVSVPCLREEDMLVETVAINRSPWKARECFQGRRYSKESDVWAFGIVLWEMFMKTVPFQNMEDDTILKIFQQDHHLAYPRWCHESIGTIMKSCWITEPTQRPTFVEIVVKLRSIPDKLTAQERKRTIPETIDEKFTIEPLNMKRDKPSPDPLDDNLPRTSSCGSHDNPDGAERDFGSNEGSYLTDDSDLDLIPEKESPEMLWSPEEIELKRLERKYPRPTVAMTQPTEDATYDRIGQNDYSVETTRLLEPEQDSVASEERYMNGAILDETQTAVHDPMKPEQRSVEANPTFSEYISETNQDVPRVSGEDDSADDDEVKPLFRKTAPSLTNFASLKTMDHMGFLSSQLGSEGLLMGDDDMHRDKGSVSVGRDTTLVNSECTGGMGAGMLEPRSTCIPNEPSEFFSGSLDPFAADSDDRANVIFSNLNSATPSGPASQEEKYIAKTRFEMGVRQSGYNPKDFNPMMVKQPPNSPYIMRGNGGYIATPAASSTTTREQTTTSAKADDQQTSLSGLVEFSRLDPFAMGFIGSSGSESMGVSSNEPALPPQESPTCRQNFVNIGERSVKAGQDDSAQDGVLFSSFLDRDPMSELSTNDGGKPSHVLAMASTSLTAKKQNISPNVNNTRGTYVSSPYNLGSVSDTGNTSSSVHAHYNSAPPAVPKFSQAGQATNKHANRSGYVSIRSSFPKPIASNAERERTNYKPNPKSHDVGSFGISFSERDPFSEAIGGESYVTELNNASTRTSGQPQDLKPRAFETPGVSPAGVRRTEITGATFENLLSKSSGPVGFMPPGIVPQGSTSPVLKPPSFMPSSSALVTERIVSNPSVNKSQPHSPISQPTSIGKPSLSNLALKLSESKQSAARSGVPQQPTLPGFKPASKGNASSNSVKNTAPRSSYVTVSQSAKPEDIKTPKVHGINEPSAMPSDFVSLSNHDVFSSILQSSFPRRGTPCPTSVSQISGLKGGKVFTVAESDKGPHKKVSRQGNMTQEKATRTTSPIRQTNSNYQSTVDGTSTSLKSRVANLSSDTPTRVEKPLGQKPRAKTPELVSSMTCQSKGEEVKPSKDEKVGDNAAHLGSQVDTTVHTELDMGNNEPEGSAFDNRDPFAEISSSQHDLNRQTSQELTVIRNGPENERYEPQQDFESTSEQGSKTKNKTVVVTSYSNAAPRPDETSNPLSNEQPSSSCSSSGGPPDGHDDRNPPPLGKKPSANRKVSADIHMDYAKVSIQPKESISHDEPGAVGGVEPGTHQNDVTEQDIPVETVIDQTVVDIFNMPGAAKSIDELDPYRHRHGGKTGKNNTETIEEIMKSHEIPFEYLTFGRELGQGAFGVVRKAKLTRPGHGHKTLPPRDVAVKCCKDGASEIYKNSFKQEAINLMKLDNKFIVQFLGVAYAESDGDQKNLLLVTELVPQGSLDKYLKDPKNQVILGNEVLLQFAIQITLGMQYLESKKLVHRDLAARNILVATESHVKISDFGLSRIYDDEYYRSHRENQKLPIRWLAPECLEQKKFTVYSDVWSLGVTLWEMFSYGKRPYEDWNIQHTGELIQALKSGKRLVKPPACHDDVYYQIQECWKLNPPSRISFFLLKTFLEIILKDKYSKKPYFM